MPERRVSVSGGETPTGAASGHHVGSKVGNSIHLPSQAVSTTLGLRTFLGPFLDAPYPSYL